MFTDLILGIERHHTCLMCPDDRFASLDYVWTRFSLQLVRNQEQQERSLEQVDAKEEGHELKARVEIEDVADGLCRVDGVAGGRDEALRADPEVVIVQQVDRIPLAREQNVQHVHDVGVLESENTTQQVS